ncbi:antitoxin [Streptomyces sp. CRN 30]|uniref:antitoxin n=1 Tax=Streptomyces sp. CRN 30 TaxID=3075613 RepID=UPI002A827FBF|nr:antitoxin [Streptomyces sp. CRN 30]
MGLLDSLKARCSPATNRISGLAKEHGDKVGRGIDKAAHMVDEKTKGRYSDRIHMGTDRAKNAVDRLAHKDDGTGSPPPPPAS